MSPVSDHLLSFSFNVTREIQLGLESKAMYRNTHTSKLTEFISAPILHNISRLIWKLEGVLINSNRQKVVLNRKI
jgi:hypothetical protein